MGKNKKVVSPFKKNKGRRPGRCLNDVEMIPFAGEPFFKEQQLIGD